MPKQGVDRRVRYTKMVLKESLLELMETQPISRITTTALCARADINRNTFYAHYASPLDLLTQIEQALYAEIQQSIERSLKAGTISTLLLEVCHSIAANRELCTVLFSEHGDKDFLRRVVWIAHDRSLADWQSVAGNVSAARFELLYTFIANGSVAVIQAWVQGGMQTPPQDVARFMEQVTNHGLGAFL